MGYLISLINYLKTEKARHDLFDYLRAMVIMAAVMALVRVVIDILRW